MPSRIGSFDVEAVRFVEDGWVAVGGGQIDEHQVAPLQLLAGQFDLARAIRAVSCTGDSSRSISSTALGHRSGRRRNVSRWSGVSSSMRIPLPSRLTVVSKPAANTSPAIAWSSLASK